MNSFDSVTAQRTIPVSILLSVYNGAAFLAELLQSLQRQTHADWTLIWRDDGSTDQTRQIMRHFSESLESGRCLEVTQGGDHLGVARSFGLLLDHVPDGHCVAFCDQDDVWLPDKLERAVKALAPFCPTQVPALYCSRQILTDAGLKPFGVSPSLPEKPVFLMALTQNIATGCTVVLSPAAVHVVRAAMPPPFPTLHDWWSYLLVSGAGGVVVTDNQPSLYYRQHQGNTVGVPAHIVDRALKAMRRGPNAFMSTFRANVRHLLGCATVLREQNRAWLADLQRALDMKGPKGWAARYRLSRRLGQMRRTAFMEQQVFRLWFILG